jgi:hypothetical protein
VPHASATAVRQASLVRSQHASPRMRRGLCSLVLRPAGEWGLQGQVTRGWSWTGVEVDD